MAAYEDDEQLEALKKWWAENGTSVIAGIVLGVGALVGWKAWTSYQINRAEKASTHFAHADKATVEKMSDLVVENVKTLQEEYASTPYAALASLELARLKAESDDLEVVGEQLRWAMEHSNQELVQNIARIRLARVLTAQSKYEEALELLAVPMPQAYNSLVAEVRGDAYRGKGEIDKARDAYDRAIFNASGNTDYLRMKRDDLGEPASKGSS